MPASNGAALDSMVAMFAEENEFGHDSNEQSVASTGSAVVGLESNARPNGPIVGNAAGLPKHPTTSSPPCTTSS